MLENPPPNTFVSRLHSKVSLSSLEVFVWIVISLFISWRFWISLLLRSSEDWSALDALYYFASYLLAGGATFLFPIIFMLIFGNYPFARLRQITAKRREYKEITRKLELEAAYRKKDILLQDDVHKVYKSSESTSQEKSPEETLKSLVDLSRKLSEGIYSRAGVYLLIGVMIAFIGVGFFYIQTTKLSEVKEFTILLMNLAPRFGVLFFIEVLAFFFLRQYRIAMEEFRYYEAIKRFREDTLTLIHFARNPIDGLTSQDFITKCSFYSEAGKLSSGETTEMLEVNKLNKDELEIIEKLISAFLRK